MTQSATSDQSQTQPKNLDHAKSDDQSCSAIPLNIIGTNSLHLLETTELNFGTLTDPTAPMNQARRHFYIEEAVRPSRPPRVIGYRAAPN